MTPYAFATTWVVAAPIDRVWTVLVDDARWHEWLPAVRDVTTVETGAEDGTGRVLQVTVRGPLPYDLAFRVRVARAEPPRLLELAAEGDLDGTGRGSLAEEEGVTTLRFEWRVATTKAWMNAIAPAARPLFAWNHDRVMTSAGRRLARLLDARLLANESGPVDRTGGGTAAAAVLTVAVLVGTAIALGRRRR